MIKRTDTGTMKLNWSGEIQRFKRQREQARKLSVDFKGELMGS